jgi:arylsulfatase A-like enzyme
MAVILLDSASSFFFQCLQGEDRIAPVAEALAAEAVVFEAAVTPAPYTLPSVGSILTGLLPDRHGVVYNANREGMNLKLSERTATLAGTLAKAGYATFGVVTNPNAANLYGYGKGFARYEELFKDPALWREGVDPAEAVERAKALIRAHRASGDHPFFLYLHLFQPHAPYTPPESYTSRFAKPYDGPVDGSRAVIDGFKEKGDPPLTGRDFEQLKDLYAANLAFADDAAGDFLDWMRAEGLFEDALIVLCSDHGEAFGEHRSIEHGHHLYEEALRVPLLIKFPGGRFKGKRVEETVSLVDLAPTLAAAAGAPAEGLGRDGIDLEAHLEGRAAWPERVHAARSDVFKPSFSLRWRGYQYIYDTLNRREELYYLPGDPRQQQELLDARPVIAGYLRARLCRMLCDVLAEAGGEAVKLNDEFIQSVQDLGYTGGGGKAAAAPSGSGERVCPLLRGR